MSEDHEPITPEMTIIEVLQQHRHCEAVFRRYEQEAQGCLLCHALFDTLEEAAAKYGLNLDRLLKDLEACAAGLEGDPGTGTKGHD